MELSIRLDHVQLIVAVPPIISVQEYVRMVKGRSAIRVLQRFKDLKRKPYWGNHVWNKGYCVDTVGLSMDKMQAYVGYQDKQDRQI